MKGKKITTLSVPFPGVTRVLSEMKLVFGSEHTIVEKGMKLPIESDIVILGAWTPTYEQLLPHIRGKIGVLWTSTITQSSYEPIEINYIMRVMDLLNEGKIDFVWFGSKEWLEVFDNENIFYCPYPISTEVKEYNVQKLVNHAGLFCPTHPRKNIVNQILALRGTDVTMNTNIQGYDGFIKEMGIKCTHNEWMSREAYEKVISSMQVGMQVSHLGVESLNYVAVDFMLRGIPCISSVEWIPEELRVKDPTNISEIREKLKYALVHKELEKKVKEHIVGMAEQNNQKIREVFNKL